MRSYLEFAMPILRFISMIYIIFILYGIFRAHGFTVSETLAVIVLPLLLNDK